MINKLFEKKETEEVEQIEPALSNTMMFRFLEPKINKILLEFYTFVSLEWSVLESREKRHPEYALHFIQECYIRVMPLLFLNEERLEPFIVKYEDDFYVLLAQYMLFQYKNQKLDFLTEEQQFAYIDIVHKLKMHKGLKLAS